MTTASLIADNGQQIAQGTPIKTGKLYTDADGNPINKATYSVLLSAFPAPKPVKDAKTSLADKAKDAAGALLDKLAASGGTTQVTVPTKAPAATSRTKMLLWSLGGASALGLVAYLLVRKGRKAKRHSRR